MTEAMISALKAAKNGDRDAAQALIEENTGLIWSIARRFFGRGVDAEDLFQLGCVGFLKAITGYDEEYGTQFSTYAVPKISGEIRRFLRDDGAVKVSRGIKERAQVIKTARNDLEQILGREPTLSEISAHTEIDIADIASAEIAVGPTESLQRETGEDGFSLEQVLGDSLQEEKFIENLALRECVNMLPEREKKVISLRYYHSMTQDSTARVLGVSQVQISRLEKRAVLKLREMLGG